MAKTFRLCEELSGSEQNMRKQNMNATSRYFKPDAVCHIATIFLFFLAALSRFSIAFQEFKVLNSNFQWFSRSIMRFSPPDIQDIHGSTTEAKPPTGDSGTRSNTEASDVFWGCLQQLARPDASQKKMTAWMCFRMNFKNYQKYRQCHIFQWLTWVCHTWYHQCQCQIISFKLVSMSNPLMVKSINIHLWYLTLIDDISQIHRSIDWTRHLVVS